MGLLSVVESLALSVVGNLTTKALAKCADTTSDAMPARFLAGVIHEKGNQARFHSVVRHALSQVLESQPNAEDEPSWILMVIKEHGAELLYALWVRFLDQEPLTDETLRSAISDLCARYIHEAEPQVIKSFAEDLARSFKEALVTGFMDLATLNAVYQMMQQSSNQHDALMTASKRQEARLTLISSQIQQVLNGKPLWEEKPPSRFALGQVPPVRPLPKGSRVPFPANKHFVGRVADLLEIHRNLKPKVSVALAQRNDYGVGAGLYAGLTGSGGMGKTQLALAYAHRYGVLFPGGVFWVNFSDPDLIAGEIASCGRAMGVAEFDTPIAEAEFRTRNVWEDAVPRLLIFDNCEDYRLFETYRPKSGGCRVLLTSRIQNWPSSLGIKAQFLDRLSPEDGLALLFSLCRRLKKERSVAESIVTELDGFPLALHLAAGYLESDPEESATEYLAALEACKSHESLDEIPEEGHSPTGHVLSVAATFSLSLQKLNPENERDARALDLLAAVKEFKPGDPFPRKLLLAVFEEEGKRKQTSNACRRLENLGLLEKPSEEDLRVHRLLHQFIKRKVEKDQRTRVQAMLLNKADAINHSGDPRELTRWAEHLKWVTDHAKEEDQTKAGLCNTMGFYLCGVGDFRNAKPYYEQALAIWRKVLGEEHPDTAVSLNNLGSLLQDMGALKGAKPYYEQALGIRRKVLGEEHPATALSLNNLGSLLQDMGALKGAKPYYEQALGIRRKVLGEEHPDTAVSLNNLGSLLQGMGELEAAKPYYEQGLAIRRKVLGEEHRDTAVSLNNLGSLLQAMGELEAAKPYYEQGLGIRRKVLGEEHLDTAGSLNNLGNLLLAMGELKAVKPYYDQALAIRRKWLGEEHPDTAGSLNNLGHLVFELGDRTQAIEYLSKAVEIAESKLGESHPRTILFRRNYEFVKNSNDAGPT